MDSISGKRLPASIASDRGKFILRETKKKKPGLKIQEFFVLPMVHKLGERVHDYAGLLGAQFGESLAGQVVQAFLSFLDGDVSLQGHFAGSDDAAVFFSRTQDDPLQRFLGKAETVMVVLQRVPVSAVGEGGVVLGAEVDLADLRGNDEEVE